MLGAAGVVDAHRRLMPQPSLSAVEPLAPGTALSIEIVAEKPPPKLAV